MVKKAQWLTRGVPLITPNPPRPPFTHPQIIKRAWQPLLKRPPIAVTVWQPHLHRARPLQVQLPLTEAVHPADMPPSL